MYAIKLYFFTHILGISKNLDGESKNYLALAKNWWNVDKVSPIKLYQENRSLSGFNLHSFLFNQMFNSHRYINEIYAKLFNLYRDGAIKPVIDSVYSFDDVCDIYFYPIFNQSSCTI